MAIVTPDSLAATLDAVNEALFFGRAVGKTEREGVAAWIAARQGLPGSYAGMFAPTEKNLREGARFFTGEHLPSRAGTAHVLGEEACRALILLDASDAGARAALERARQGMLGRLRAAEARERNTGRLWLGTYCCGKCSVALWRHLAAGGLEDSERHLAAAMKALQLNRDGTGKWRRFPFHYTLLALSEVNLPAAIEEMRYAAPTLERLLTRRQADGPFERRRRAVAERILAKC